MGKETISLTNEAHERLTAARRDHESFSDVVLRLTESSDAETQVATLAGGLGTELANAVADSSAEVSTSLDMDSGRTE